MPLAAFLRGSQLVQNHGINDLFVTIVNKEVFKGTLASVIGEVKQWMIPVKS